MTCVIPGLVAISSDVRSRALPISACCGCDLIEGEYWEEDDEFGCELESGNELLCNDDGECTSGVMMSLDDILERLNILEYYPSILELRVVAFLNNGQGPLTNMADETIIIEGETPCNNTGNVYVEIGAFDDVECVCDIGFIEVGTEENGFPMCVQDWNDGDNDPPPPPPQPDPPPPPPLPDPEPTCSQEEFLRDMKRAEQDYKQCIFGAVDSRVSRRPFKADAGSLMERGIEPSKIPVSSPVSCSIRLSKSPERSAARSTDVASWVDGLKLAKASTTRRKAVEPSR